MSVPKLRFKEFDGDWKIKKLGNSFNLISGYAFPSSASVDKGAKWLKIADVGIQEMTPSSLSYLPHEFLEKYPQFIVSKDDYVIALTRPILNKKLKIAKVGSSYDGALLNQRVAKIQTNENDLGFIYSLLQKSKTVEELENSISGTDPPNLSLNDVKDIRLGFPSIEEQTKIATFLSAVDEKISQLTQKHQLLSQYKQGMMQKLFSQQICFKADDGSEFGEWEEIKLTDFLKFTPRPIEKPNTNYHALGVRSHFKGLFNKFDSEPNKISMDTLYRVKRNDVVVNITFAWEGAMAIAEKEHDEGLVSHRFPTYLCDDSKINLHFFKYRFIQKDFLSALQLCSPGGAGRNRVLNKSAFLEISFSKPTLEEQTKIANFLSSIDQKIVVVAQQIEQAKQWKKGLLQQMFV